MEKMPTEEVVSGALCQIKKNSAVCFDHITHVSVLVKMCH